MKATLWTLGVLIIAAVSAVVLNFVGVFALTSADGTMLAARIAASLSSKTGTSVHVTCPPKIPEKKGGIEDCEANAGGATTIVRVTQDDSRGHLHWIVADPDVLQPTAVRPGALSTPSPELTYQPATPVAATPDPEVPSGGHVEVVADCSTPSSRPTSIVLTCADAGIQLTELTWSTFGGPQAHGYGVYYANDCSPSCATGHFHKYPIKITLTHVVQTDVAAYYGQARLTFLGERPPGDDVNVWELTT